MSTSYQAQKMHWVIVLSAMLGIRAFFLPNFLFYALFRKPR